MQMTKTKTCRANISSNSNKTQPCYTKKVSSRSFNLYLLLDCVEFFSMKDLRYGMTRPCTIDIKLGSQAYNPKKMERQQWKMSVSTSSELGFRLCGLSFYDQKPDGSFEAERTTVSKYTCRQIDKSQMIDHLKRFLCISKDDVEDRSPLVGYLISELQKIQQILTECT